MLKKLFLNLLIEKYYIKVNISEYETKEMENIRQKQLIQFSCRIYFNYNRKCSKFDWIGKFTLNKEHENKIEKNNRIRKRNI